MSRLLKNLPFSGQMTNSKVIFLYIGDSSWEESKKDLEDKKYCKSLIHDLLCLPPYECHKQYKWPVKDTAILVHDTGIIEYENKLDLIKLLLRNGAAYIHYVSPLYSQESFRLNRS